MRAIGWLGPLLLASAISCAQAAAVCMAPPSGLIGWWPGDGNARDIWGGNDGALANGATTAAGKVDQAFVLDGVDDQVTIPHDSKFNPTGPFSVELWSKADVTQGTPQILLFDKSHGFSDGSGWGMQTAPGGTVAFFYGTGGSTLDFHGPTSTTVITDGNWHHIAGVFTGTEIRIYVDGTSQGSVTFSMLPVNNTRPMFIGRSWGGGTPTRALKGAIDEVSYYGRALTDMEVAGLAAAGVEGKCKIATLDVDRDGQYDALSDGIIIIRYMLGLRGAALNAGVQRAGALVTDPAQLANRGDALGLALDIDGNNQVDLYTDGLLILRYMFGLRGAALVADAVGSNPSRDEAQIQSHLQSLTP